jgi:hypothetical protein
MNEAFNKLIAASDQALDQEDLTIQGFQQAARVAESRRVSIGKCLTAMGNGTSGMGDKIMLKTVGILATYLSSWGVIVIISFGLYQLVQAAEAAFAKVMEIGKSAVKLFAHPVETVLGWFSDNTKSDGELKLLVETGATLAATAVPEFGVIYGFISRAFGKSDRVGGNIHDTLNFGAVPVRASNFVEVDEDTDHEQEIRDYGVEVAQAALATGADKDVFRDALRDILAGNVVHDHLEDDAEDVIDDAEDDAAEITEHRLVR